MPPNICDNVKILATTLASDAVPIFFVTKICASFVPKIVAPTRKKKNNTASARTVPSPASLLSALASFTLFFFSSFF